MTTEPESSTDELIRDLLARHPLRFEVATDDEMRRAAFALRHAAVLEQGWGTGSDEELDRDEYDDRAVILIGWFEDTAVATGRVVLPGGPLPTEVECAISVEPAGQVVDVGRMAVAPSQRGWHKGAFAALLAALYTTMRDNGYAVATGMMARDVRGLVRLLGLRLEVLGPERLSNGAMRAPVRFACDQNEASLRARWATQPSPPTSRPPG